MKSTEITYTLEDLRKWNYEGVTLCVMGHPIDHSISPIIQNAALMQMAKDDPNYKNWRYFKFDILPHDLEEALRLSHQKGILGINLTMPHKVEAIKIISSIDDVAKKMGAVNSLIYAQEGYQGFNSDGYGMEIAIRKELGVELKNEAVIIIGAGGAARAAAVQCLLKECRELWIGNRSRERLDDILKSIGIMGREKVRGFDLMNLPEDLPKKGILINTTSLGMDSTDGSPIQLEFFNQQLKVFDMIYRDGETALVREARKMGMKSCGGLRMLVEQGAQSLKIWAKREIPVDAMWEEGKMALSLV